MILVGTPAKRASSGIDAGRYRRERLAASRKFPPVRAARRFAFVKVLNPIAWPVLDFAAVSHGTASALSSGRQEPVRATFDRGDA